MCTIGKGIYTCTHAWCPDLRGSMHCKQHACHMTPFHGTANCILEGTGQNPVQRQLPPLLSETEENTLTPLAEWSQA